MLNVAAVMLPIAALIGLGFVAVRLGGTSEAHIEGLSRFVLHFALPAVVLGALARQDLSQSFQPAYVAAYGAGSLVAFLGVFAVLRLAMARPLAPSAMGALGASASNTGFIGFPVALIAFGAPASAALPMTMLVETMLIIPLALMLAEMGGAARPEPAVRLLGRIALRLARMPLILAIALGAAIALTGLGLPGPVLDAVDLLARASAATALFVVGGTVAGLRFADISPDILAIVAGKLLVHPLAVAGAFSFAPGVTPELARTGILFASVSMITVYPIFSARFGLRQSGVAALLVATAAGLFTVSAILGLLLRAGP